MSDSSMRPRPIRADSFKAPTDEAYRALVENVRDYAIFLLDEHGNVASWNAGAERIKGYRASEVIGSHFSRFYTDEANDIGWPEHELETARATGRFEDEGWRLRKDGTRFWANVVITALYDENHRVTGFVKVTRDLSERRRQEESLRQSEERMRMMIEAVEDYALFMLDPEGLVSSWNTGARRILGYRPDEILGRSFSRLYTPEDIARRQPERSLTWARARGRVEDEGWRVRQDGSRFWANSVMTPFQEHDGTLAGFALVTRDMTERRRVETLEESGRRMQEFIAMLAHELRNPLAPIRNAASVMRLKHVDKAALEWTRDVLERQVEHLTRLVDDLLDVSRITSGKVELRRSSQDLGEVIARAVEASRPVIDARHHTLEVSVPKDPIRIDGDAVRLAQSFTNVLNNAAKFTPPGGRITLAATRENGTAVVRITDDGAGMSADLLPRIFDLFTQGSHGEDRSGGGLGLGLTLVRRLIEMHGGTIEASSPGPGEGSTFEIRLPIESRTEPAPPPKTLARASGKRVTARRVLVVDDNADSADTISLLLRLKGHEVRTAHDGPSALRVAEEFQPQVVLLDIGLPGMSGYQVAQILRGLPGLRDVTLVAVTGYGQAEDRRRAIEAGLDHHLVKPVDPAAIEEVLSAAGSAS